MKRTDNELLELVKEWLEYKEDGLYWKKRPVNLVRVGDRFGGIVKRNSNHPIRAGSLQKQNYYEHRLVYLLHHGRLPILPNTVDHKNNNSLDNRIDNLREATNSEQSRNKSSLKNSSSKYLGVGFHKPTRKWVSYITVNGKYKHLGLYATEIDAAKAYDKAAIEYHGEFANPNFVINGV